MKLNEYLAQAGQSPKEFANELGVTTEAVRLYLAGKRTPRAHIMWAIREATGGKVTPDDFLVEPESHAA